MTGGYFYQLRELQIEAIQASGSGPGDKSQRGTELFSRLGSGEETHVSPWCHGLGQGRAPSSSSQTRGVAGVLRGLPPNPCASMDTLRATGPCPISDNPMRNATCCISAGVTTAWGQHRASCPPLLPFSLPTEPVPKQPQVPMGSLPCSSQPRLHPSQPSPWCSHPSAPTPRAPSLRVSAHSLLRTAPNDLGGAARAQPHVRYSPR